MSTVQTVQTIATSTLSHEIITISHENTTLSQESPTTSRDFSLENEKALFPPSTPSRDFSLENKNALFQPITTFGDFSLKNKSALSPPIIPGAIYFPIYSITMKYENDKLRKKIGFPNEWEQLEVSDPHHPLRAILTGKPSNLTVVDIDRMSSHRKLLEAIPELASVRTVKTRKGFHLFFTYDPRLKSTTDCFTVPKIDIRNDRGCVLAPPTTYSYEGTVYGYEDMGGVVGPIPEALYEFIMPRAFKDDDPVAIAAYAADMAESPGSAVETMDEEEKAVVMGQVQHLVSLLSPERARPYSSWSETGFAIHHELGMEGLELFLEFSSKAGKAYDRVGCISFYRKLRRRLGSSLTMGSLCYWAKQDSPVEYAAYRAKYPIAPVETVDSDASASESESAPMEPKKAMRTVANDWEAGLLIYGELSNVLMYSSGALYFKRDHIWIQNEGEIRSALRVYVMQASLYKTNSKKECVAYSQQYKNACCIVQCIIDQAITHQDSGWATTLYTSSYGYVLHTNGYWDFMGGRFVAMDSPEFDDTIRFLEQIPFDYKEEMGAQNAERVRHTLFYEPFGPRVAEYFMRQLARGLAGDSMKRFLVGIGPSNTGKSILTGALRNACGPYFGDWTGANLVDRHTSQDGGQQLRWLMLLRTKRIIVSNELKSRQTLDANLMKSMSSGGEDGISAREHGGNEQQGVTTRFLPILMAQDLGKLSVIDDALSDRLRAIPYSKVYTDAPSNALELKKDPRLVNDIKTEGFRMGFLHVLYDSYTRFHRGGRIEEDIDEIKEAVKDVIGKERNIIDSFTTHFEITNNPADYVMSSVMKTWLIDEKLGVSDTKLGMELKRHAQINGLEHVLNKNKKINRKIVVVWQGVRVYSEIDQDP